jgi:hypothetical protein
MCMIRVSHHMIPLILTIYQPNRPLVFVAHSLGGKPFGTVFINADANLFASKTGIVVKQVVS